MKNSLNAFLGHLIDYAGLFPPANLPLETAIQNYHAYQSSKDNWMLGPFIIPGSRLDELDPYVSMFSVEQPLTISAVGRKSASVSECLKGLQADFEAIEAFRNRHGDMVKITVLELPLPPVPLERQMLETIANETSKYGLGAFCEVTVALNSDWEKKLKVSLDAIAAHNADHHHTLGFKLRTGGVTADAFPTPEQVAAAIVGCRDRGIAMKFTAGLHHPIRMYRNEVDTKMHGFLNVFTAGILAHVHNLDLQTTRGILGDEDPKSFSFTNEKLVWRNIVATTSDVDRLRNTSFCSYGCCSFDEPREDLQELQIL